MAMASVMRNGSQETTSVTFFNLMKVEVKFEKDNVLFRYIFLLHRGHAEVLDCLKNN
jgi:hypothetical protein